MHSPHAEAAAADPLAPAFDALAAALDASSRVLLTAPGDLDGDAVGALVALARALPRRWPRVFIQVAAADACPDRLRFLGGEDVVIDEPPAVGDAPFDLVIVVDGGPDRLGAMAPHWDRARRQAVVDHHRSTAGGAFDLPLVDAAASSTTTLLYRAFARWGLTLDAALAEPLFAGLVFDTSVFRYRLTSPESLRAAGHMLETGIDHARIVERVLLDQSEGKARLRGIVLGRFQRASGGAVAWSWLSADEAEGADTGGLVDDLVFIEGVEVGALIRARSDGAVKLSLRSKGGVDVAAVARGLTTRGGGHARAAGATLEGPLESACQAVLAAVDTALGG